MTVNTPPFFDSLAWSDLITLYPSILILLSSLGIELFKKSFLLANYVIIVLCDMHLN